MIVCMRLLSWQHGSGEVTLSITSYEQGRGMMEKLEEKGQLLKSYLRPKPNNSEAINPTREAALHAYNAAMSVLTCLAGTPALVSSIYEWPLSIRNRELCYSR